MMESKSVSKQQPKVTLSPMLSVRRGARAVEFYKTAFGATQLFRIEAPDGAVVARLGVGESTFWVADESPESEFQSGVLGRGNGAHGDGSR